MTSLPTNYNTHLNPVHREFLPSQTTKPEGFSITLPDIPTTNNAYFPGLGNCFDLYNYNSNYASYGGTMFLVQTQAAVNTTVTTYIVGYIEVSFLMTFYNRWS